MEDSISDNNKFGKQKFMMGKGHYHKLFSKPSDTKENLIYVSHGNDICYKGVIPNIPQLSEVIWPKDNVRELSKEEISRFHGSTIRIDQWINCKIDIVNNTITTEVIRPGFDIPRGEA